MALTDLAECSPISLTACLTNFIDSLDTTEKETMKTAVESSDDELVKLSAKLGQAAAGAKTGLKKLQDADAAFDAKITSLTSSLAKIDAYLATTPCNELTPIRNLLDSVKTTLEAQKALVNLSALSSVIDTALASRALLDGYEKCLSTFSDALE